MRGLWSEQELPHQSLRALLIQVHFPWVKTLFGRGRASAAPLASHPPWGRRLLRPDLTCGGRCVAFGGEGGLGVACWVVVARPWLCRKKKRKKKKKVGSSFSFERGRREGVFIGCVRWFVSTAGESCGDPDRFPFPDRSFTVVWVDRVDVPIRPMSCKVERCVLRSQSNPPECLVCVVCGPESFGSSAPLVVRLIDQSYLVFGPDFPYKLGQLSSSHKNSGKHKLSPSGKAQAFTIRSKKSGFSS
jgi:hypothetical protein